MDFAAGLAMAYVKILSVALVIMVGVWLLAKISVALHNRAHPPADGNDHD